jgi:hypothetical protein
MRSLLRFILVASACVTVVVGVTYWLTRTDRDGRSHPDTQAAQPDPRVSTPVIPPQPYPSPSLPTFPDPTAPLGSSAQVFIDPQAFDSLIGAATAQFTDAVRDESSILEYRAAISHRVERAKAQLRERSQLIHLDPTPTLDQALPALWIYRQFAFVALYEGNHEEEADWLKKALTLAKTPGVPESVRAHLTGLLGINALRWGEQDNCIGCVGPSSCIFPIAAEAVHTRPSGSREAVSATSPPTRRSKSPKLLTNTRSSPVNPWRFRSAEEKESAADAHVRYILFTINTIIRNIYYDSGPYL